MKKGFESVEDLSPIRPIRSPVLEPFGTAAIRTQPWTESRIEVSEVIAPDTTTGISTSTIGRKNGASLPPLGIAQVILDCANP